jgi:short-subunit dehydrogenase
MPYAVVTGATQGIGKAIAEKLLQEGFSIAICARNAHDLETLEKKWNEQYPLASIVAYNADLTSKEDLVTFAATILAAFPVIDVLVNNAGTYFPGTIADEPDGYLEQLMAINLYSAYHLTRQLLPEMKARKAGHIFNICSIASLRAYANGGSYGITKYALLGFSENLREELKPDKIKVTAICPGATYSRSWEQSGVGPEDIMKASDVANMLWAAYHLSADADVETIVMRPLKGDL